MSEKYDFDFITGALGLVPHPGGAFNPAQVVMVHKTDDNGLVIVLTDEDVIKLHPEHVEEMEAMIRKRQDEVKARRREEIKEQILAQQSVIDELNNRPAPGHIVPPFPKRGRG